MTGVNGALWLLTGLALLFSMAAILGVVVVRHNQVFSAYDDDTCPGCQVLGSELARQAKALSDVWRFVEAVDDRRIDVSGPAVQDETVRVGH